MQVCTLGKPYGFNHGAFNETCCDWLNTLFASSVNKLAQGTVNVLTSVNVLAQLHVQALQTSMCREEITISCMKDEIQQQVSGPIKSILLPVTSSLHIWDFESVLNLEPGYLTLEAYFSRYNDRCFRQCRRLFPQFLSEVSHSHQYNKNKKHAGLF